MARIPPLPAQQQLIDRLREHLADEPVTCEASMFGGRDMGPGWIRVAASAVGTDEDLDSWLAPALAYNRSATDRMARRQE